MRRSLLAVLFVVMAVVPAGAVPPIAASRSTVA